MKIFQTITKSICALLIMVSLTAGSAFAQAGGCIEDGVCAKTGNAISAAYSTEGYWALSAILEKAGLRGTNGGLANGSLITILGGLIYILAVMGALIMMALGQPPKMYVWFAMGPALFYFLLFNSVERKGVAWVMPNMELATIVENQKSVWKLAYQGLSTSGLVADGATFDKETGPGGVTEIPFVFAMVDEFASNLSFRLVELMGVTDIVDDATAGNVDNWHLLSNHKWELLENITQAKIFNTDLRELMVVFMASECGDKVGEYINKPSFTAASTTNGRNLPFSIFDDKTRLLTELENITIPLPYVARQLFKEMVDNSFIKFAFQSLSPTVRDKLKNVTSIRCDDLLWMVVQAVRWESGMQYAKIPETLEIQSLTPLDQSLINYTFLYQWEDNLGNPILGINREKFMHNLIMAYMFRNELALVPSQVEQRMLPSDKTTTFADGFQRNINSKNKFSEFYTWSKLMPHMQGLILYILAIAYPIACIMILIPGHWKWMFTWTSFYLWAKSWDVGFAIVVGLEKSIWGNIGSSLSTSVLNGRILGFNKTVDTKIIPPTPLHGPTLSGAPLGDLPPKIEEMSVMTEELAINILEEAMILSRALNHDLANSYYIYLMSALYFAVPALTGQVILGAKAGMSGMVKDAIGGVSAESGSASKAGAVAEVTQHGNLNAQAASQTHAAKANRENGLAFQALQGKNSAMGMRLEASRLKGLAEMGSHRNDAMRDRASYISGIGGVKMAGLQKKLGAANSAVDTLQAFSAKDSSSDRHLAEIAQMMKNGTPMAPPTAKSTSFDPQVSSGTAASSESQTIQGQQTGNAQNNNRTGANASISSSSQSLQTQIGEGNTIDPNVNGNESDRQINVGQQIGQNGSSSSGLPRQALSTSRGDRANSATGVQSGISSGSGVQTGIGEGETRTIPDNPQTMIDNAKGLAQKYGPHAARSGIKYTGDSAQELKAFHDFNATEAQLQSSFAARSGQINSGVEGFKLGSLADGLGEQSGRMNQRANYLAQEGSYRDDAKFAQQIAGSMSAMGVSPGAFDPRNKPRDNDSMAAGGLFGASYNEAFSYPETGFLQEVGAAYNDISSSASSAKIHYSHNTEGNYFDDGLVSSLGHTVSSFGEGFKELINSGEGK